MATEDQRKKDAILDQIKEELVTNLKVRGSLAMR